MGMRRMTRLTKAFSKNWVVSRMRVDPSASILSAEIVDTKGQKREWTIPREGYRFIFGVVEESTRLPEFVEGIWVSQTSPSPTPPKLRLDVCEPYTCLRERRVFYFGDSAMASI
jgi:hypothetical protein